MGFEPGTPEAQPRHMSVRTRLSAPIFTLKLELQSKTVYTKMVSATVRIRGRSDRRCFCIPLSAGFPLFFYVNGHL